MFRPYRDVRFAKDKTPYKTHQGAFVAGRPGVRLVRRDLGRGVRTGGGFYDASGPDLARIRASIDHEATGRELQRILAKLEKAGFEIGGDKLKTSPRGYDADHPRIELLRHKSITVGQPYGFDKVIHSPDLLDAVRKDWRALRPLVDWVSDAPRRLRATGIPGGIGRSRSHGLLLGESKHRRHHLGAAQRPLTRGRPVAQSDGPTAPGRHRGAHVDAPRLRRPPSRACPGRTGTRRDGQQPEGHRGIAR